jgi:sugar phosphate isomerase/epimerase
MKLGFSTAACPAWDLATIVGRAKELGYQGVEVSALEGRAITASDPALAGDPPAVRQLFADADVELACLGTPVRLCGADAGHTQAAKADVLAYLDLAARLGCPLVRVFGGVVSSGGDRNAVLAKIAAALRDLAPAAATLGVAIVLENDGPFAGSRDMWFIMDAVGHPSVRCCWNSLHAMTIRERPTLSVPRLGTRIAVVHVCDGRFSSSAEAQFEAYELPGNGQVEIPRCLELLRGIAYDGYVVFEWPMVRVASLAPPESSLPAAAKYLKGLLEA